MNRKSHSNQTNQPPRTQEEIQKDFQQNAYQAGLAQYQVEVYSTELQALNDRLKELNREAAARNLLDRKDGKVAASAEVVLPESTEQTEVANEQA